jgi:hypothetical protein
MATYNKAIKVTVDGPREPRSKTSKSSTKSFFLRFWKLHHYFSVNSVGNQLKILQTISYRIWRLSYHVIHKYSIYVVAWGHKAGIVEPEETAVV